MTKNGVLLAVTASVGLCGLVPVSAHSQPKGKIIAQQLVDEIRARHPEVTGLEMAATRSSKDGCKTIAATEAKEVGEKCDNDEFTAMKTNRPFVEKEEDGFDVTMPIHDSAGKVIGTVGIDFKPEPDQQQATVVSQAKQIVVEIEKRIATLKQLFEAVK